MSDLNSEASSLLKRARSADLAPPPSSKKRMRAAIVAGLALPALGASLTQLIVVGVVSAAVGSGVTLLVSKKAAPQLVIVREPTPPLVVYAPLPPEPEPATPPPPVVQRAKPEAPPQQKPEPEALHPELPPAPRPMTPDESLAAELEAIAVILADVDASKWTDAMTALQVFHARFPNAELSVEADSLEVRTLCGLQREDAARSLAEKLVAKHPMNPSVQRIRNVCAAK